MLFNSLQFGFFLAVVLGLHRLLPRPWRTQLLLAASLIFYASWIPAYLVLLVACIVVNYALLLGIMKTGYRRAFLTAAVVYTLGLLAFFKYAAMAVETALPLLDLALGFEPPIPKILLPLGISFYSFQVLSVAIDAYRGRAPASLSFARYALFVCFFPQLIAGPILRGPELLPQLETGGSVSVEWNRRGVWLLASGLFKKVVMADFLLAPFVDDVFASPGVGSSAFHWVALYSFAFQIYFDFSGYTDMARGMAYLLGFKLPLNFTEPYLALNPNDFWRRWHITLSNWFRDYVFLPLSLRGVLRAHIYACLLVTWTLVGLWHGADWSFVLWGVYQAAILSLHRLCRPLLARVRTSSEAGRRAWVVARWLGTFNLVVLGLLLFRSESLAHAGDYLVAMLNGNPGALPGLQCGVVILCLALHAAERTIRTRLPRIHAALQTPWGPLVEASAAGVVVSLAVAVSGVGGDFIYFQF